MDAAPQEASPSRSFSYYRPLNSPVSTPQQLQNHLYQQFLTGDTSDISLSVHIDGSVGVVYKLHRIVLTQAGYFRSLFTSGFSESLYVIQGQIQLQLDHDPNITRAAFEICLARLYGGGPALHVCPTLVPTPGEPLTTAYMQPWVEQPPVPKNHHPASPRFLLSLLSTAFYLQIPSVASEALSLILSTIGPVTVIRYLNYAIGKGIGTTSLKDAEKAATLENIGQDADSASIFTTNTEATSQTETTSGLGTAGDSGVQHEPPLFLYGEVGNRIGEACVAFLTRWGMDLLDLEERQSSSQASTSNTPQLPTPSSITWRPITPSLRIWSQGLSAEWVRGILSSDELFVKSEMKRYEAAKQVVEMRRRQKGVVPAEEQEWDILFKEGIYYSHFSWEDLLQLSEERSPVTGSPYIPLSQLQAAHWSSSKLRQVITKSTSTLASATDATRQGLKLGFEVEAADLSSNSHRNADYGHEVLWPVPVDTSLRIGDPGSAATTEDIFNPPSVRSRSTRRPVNVQTFFGIGNPRRSRESFAQSDDTDPVSSSAKADKWVSYEPFRFSVEFWGVESLKEKTRLYSHTIFYAGSCYNVYTQAVRKKGLQLGVYLHRQSNVDPIPAASTPRALQTQPSPSVWPSSLPSSDSFANNRSSITLVQGSRSQVRSVPSVEPISPRATSSSSRSPLLRSTTPVAIPRAPRYIHSNASFSPSSPTSPFGSPGSPSTALLPATQTSSSTSAPLHQPYRDPRPAVSAYFSIACHSSTCSSLTRFSSAPDTFAVSQSWGWKSSSLDIGETSDDQNVQEQSLRATVVIGLV